MPKINVIVGPPCAGKTSYVLSMMDAGDVRIDYDEIAKAFGSNKAHDASGPVRQVALSARQSGIYRVLRGVDADAWVIHTNPRTDMIKEYEQRDAEFVMVNPGIEECLSRAKGRPKGTKEAIEEWFRSPPILPAHETVKMTQPTYDYGERIIRAVKRHVEEATAPLIEQIKAIGDRPAPKDGEDGKSVTVDDLAPLVADEVARVVAELPGPKDGKDSDPDDVRRMVDEAVSKVPTPKDGESVTVEQVMPELRAALANAIDEIPAPKDAPTAEDVAKVLDGRFSEWALGFERQAADLFRRAIDRMPKPEPGKPGRDFGAFAFEYDGARALTIRYEKDGETVEQVHRMPVVIDAGFFRDGESYEKGDGVTFGGSYWIAQTDTANKPEIGGDDWRLAVRKGRDSKASVRRGDL